MDSEKQTKGFGGKGAEELGESGSGGHVLHGALVWCINNEFWNTEKK